MDRIAILDNYRRFFPGLEHLRIEGIAGCFGLELPEPPRRTRVESALLKAGDGSTLHAYLKIYGYGGKRSGRWFRPGLGPREARTLLELRSWGIPAVSVVGWGERRAVRGFKGVMDFVITEAATGAVPLLDFWEGHDQPGDPALRRRLIGDLARQVALMHRKGFFHQDLKWRNLLVRPDPQPGQSPWAWIDCPNGYRLRLAWRQRLGRIKDLATLDKVARFRCTDDERMSFVRDYLGDEAEGREAEAFAAAVVRYRRRRQDP